MIDHRIITAVRRFLFGMVMLALVLTPIQPVVSFAGSEAAAMASMGEMPADDCPQKQGCCDNQKSDCPSMQSCVAPCNGIFTPVVLAEMEFLEFGPAAMTPLVIDLPDSMALLPLRRPPRA